MISKIVLLICDMYVLIHRKTCQCYPCICLCECLYREKIHIQIPLPFAPQFVPAGNVPVRPISSCLPTSIIRAGACHATTDPTHRPIQAGSGIVICRDEIMSAGEAGRNCWIVFQTLYFTFCKLVPSQVLLTLSTVTPSHRAWGLIQDLCLWEGAPVYSEKLLLICSNR